MHHLNDIADYLNANSTIINNVAILDRSFTEMEFLKPIYGAIAFLGCTSPDHFILYLSILAPHIPLQWFPLKDFTKI